MSFLLCLCVCTLGSSSSALCPRALVPGHLAQAQEGAERSVSQPRPREAGWSPCECRRRRQVQRPGNTCAAPGPDGDRPGFQCSFCTDSQSLVSQRSVGKAALDKSMLHSGLQPCLLSSRRLGVGRQVRISKLHWKACFSGSAMALMGMNASSSAWKC